jgi:hypothetical protein
MLRRLIASDCWMEVWNKEDEMFGDGDGKLNSKFENIGE